MMDFQAVNRIKNNAAFKNSNPREKLTLFPLIVPDEMDRLMELSLFCLGVKFVEGGG